MPSRCELIGFKQGATLYTIQLGLNLIWMPLFFGLKRPVEATIDIVALTGITGYLTFIWSQVDSVAAWGIAPYLGWLGFATYLSVSHLGQLCFKKSELMNEVGWHRIFKRLEYGGQRGRAVAEGERQFKIRERRR